MARLRDPWRTSLTAPQQPRNPQPEAIVRNPYDTAIVKLSGNDFLASTHEAIQARLKRIRFVGNEAPESWGGAMREHVEMMDALERRDEHTLTECPAEKELSDISRL